MINKKHILFFLFGAIAIELLSFFAHEFSSFSFLIMSLMTIFFIYIAWKDFPLALTLLFFELFIGSKGHFFAISVFGITLSFRMLLFSIIFFRGLFFKKIPLIFGSKKFLYPLLIFFFFLFLGGTLGFIKNSFSNAFFDLNGYMYFAIFFIVPEIFILEKNKKLLFEAFIAGVFWLFIKTYFLFFVFSHGIQSIAPTLYRWVRDTGLAEPTRLPDSSVYRVFLQSHIFALIAFFIFIIIFLFKKNEFQKKELYYLYSLIIFSFTLILISFSRSFFAVFILLFGLLFIFMRKHIFSLLKISCITVCGSFLLIIFGLFFPLEKFLPGAAFVQGDFLSERLRNLDEEAAAKSRWTQISPLFREIKKHPFFGNGFGKTVMYKSSDPRNLEKNPEGWYETYAFEWGYLDILLKMGVFGLGSYLLFLSMLLKRLFIAREKNPSVSFCGIIILLSVSFTHIFTPYLNHPLGIGAVLIALSLGIDDTLG